MPLTTEQQQGRAAIEAQATKSGLTRLERVYALATAWVESRWRGSAVGDNGSSFGEYQHHVGGAGGTTLESAKRYADPVVSAGERVPLFGSRDIDTGAEAAALQRPADPVGYAKKVTAAAASILRGTLPDGTPMGQAATVAASRPKWSPTQDAVLAIWQEEGMHKTSDNRSPADNRAAGGVENSNHIYDPADPSTWDTWAIDGVGPRAAMERARVRVSRLDGVIENMIHDAGSGMHHHVAGRTSGGSSVTSPSSSTDGSTTTMVGAIDSSKAFVQGIAENLTFSVVLLGGLTVAGALFVLGAVGTTGQGDSAARAAKLAATKGLLK